MDDEKLIALVEERRCLFDKGHPQYNNRLYIRGVWEEVAAEMKERVDATKKRWGYLRDYFQRQHKIVVNSKTGLVVPRKRKWRLFDSMRFLTADCIPDDTSDDTRLPVSTDNSDKEMKTKFMLRTNSFNKDCPLPNIPASIDTNHNNDQETVHLPTYSNNTVSMPTPKRTEKMSDSQVNNVIETPRASQSQMSVLHEDGNELFLKSLLPMLRTLDPLETMQFRQETQGLLIKYLRRARTETLQQTSDAATTPGSEVEVLSLDTEAGNSNATGRWLFLQDDKEMRARREELGIASPSPNTPDSASPTPSSYIEAEEDTIKFELE